MTTLEDLRDSSTDVWDAAGQNVIARIDWSEDPMTRECAPVITWEEHMKFHSERLGWAETLGDTETIPQRVEDVLHGLFDGGDFQVHVSWSDADDVDGYPFLTIEIYPVLNSAWDEDSDAVEGLLWPAIATLINVTDPGTWNSPYLFEDLVVKA